MAGNAIDCRMRADQGEAILVCAHCLQRYIPADYRVALLAICAELPAMNVRVAIGTMSTYIAEYQFGMTLDAIDLNVHAPKGITGRIVIEFWNGADRFPARLCVAIFARDGQRAVGAARFRIGRTTTLSPG